MAGKNQTVDALHLAAGRKQKVTITVDADVLLDAQSAIGVMSRQRGDEAHDWINQAGWTDTLHRLQAAITEALG